MKHNWPFYISNIVQASIPRHHGTSCLRCIIRTANQLRRRRLASWVLHDGGIASNVAKDILCRSSFLLGTRLLLRSLVTTRSLRGWAPSQCNGLYALINIVGHLIYPVLLRRPTHSGKLIIAWDDSGIHHRLA